MRGQGVMRLGSRGKREALRMFLRAQQSMTTRSRPMPPPPWGQAPYLKLSMQSLMVVGSMPLSMARCRNTQGSWMRWAPDRISSPRMKKSQEQVQAGSSWHSIVQNGRAVAGQRCSMQKSVSYLFFTSSPSFFSTSVLRSSMGGHSTPFSLSSWMPSAKVRRRTGRRHLKGANSNCWLMAWSSRAQRCSRLVKMKGKSSPKKSSSSKQCSLMESSTSIPTNSHMWRCVKEFSARKTGPISNTRWKSPITHICLYSCGDCARHALRLKQLKLNTFEPPSDVPPISFGVWISTKSLLMQNSRNRWHTPDDSLKIACLEVVRRSITRLSNRVFIFTIGASFSFSSSFSFFSSRFFRSSFGFFSFFAFFSSPLPSSPLPSSPFASSVFTSSAFTSQTFTSSTFTSYTFTSSTLGCSTLAGSSFSSSGSNSLCSTLRLASAIWRGRRLVALLTTKNLVIWSSTCWEQLSMGFSGLTTMPARSTTLSLGTADMYLSISLEMVSDLKAQAWRVEKFSRRTMKQLLPLPRTLWMRARTRTSWPSSGSATSASCSHLRPDWKVDWMKGQSPYWSVLQSAIRSSLASMQQQQL